MNAVSTPTPLSVAVRRPVAATAAVSVPTVNGRATGPVKLPHLCCDGLGRRLVSVHGTHVAACTTTGAHGGLVKRFFRAAGKRAARARRSINGGGGAAGGTEVNRPRRHGRLRQRRTPAHSSISNDAVYRWLAGSALPTLKNANPFPAAPEQYSSSSSSHGRSAADWVLKLSS